MTQDTKKVNIISIIKLNLNIYIFVKQQNSIHAKKTKKKMILLKIKQRSFGSKYQFEKKLYETEKFSFYVIMNIKKKMNNKLTFSFSSISISNNNTFNHLLNRFIITI